LLHSSLFVNRFCLYRLRVEVAAQHSFPFLSSLLFSFSAIFFSQSFSTNSALPDNEIYLISPFLFFKRKQSNNPTTTTIYILHHLLFLSFTLFFFLLTSQSLLSLNFLVAYKVFCLLYHYKKN